MRSFKTHVDVHSDHFPMTAIEMKKNGRSEFLAQHLAKQFNQQQLEIAAIHDEDWGYLLSFSHPTLLDVIVTRKMTTYF
ncbi:MAG: hypothetical protein ACN6NS_00510 [Acinetobacter johnsonii]